MDNAKDLDTRGLNCPLPILKTKKALADMVTGEVLRVVSTDPGRTRDFVYHLPLDHAGGTHWYHPHMHPLSEMFVMGGAMLPMAPSSVTG